MVGAKKNISPPREHEQTSSVQTEYKTHLTETQSEVFSDSHHYHVSFETSHLGNLAHFINVGLLLFEFSECGLYGSDDCIMVCSQARGREPTGVVEPGNVNGGGRGGDYQRRRRRAW